MPKTIDATGKACPIPFMLAKKEIDAGERIFDVVVDNKAAVENLKRLAKSFGFATSVAGEDNPFTVSFAASTEQLTPVEPPKSVPGGDYLVFMGRDTMGSGELELGRNLVRMFLYTLDQGDNLPSTIVCMNRGVYLAAEDEQCIATLRSLHQKGVEVLVCGTCINYYGLLGKLQVGTVGNMHDITQRFLAAPRTITL